MVARASRLRPSAWPMGLALGGLCVLLAGCAMGPPERPHGATPAPVEVHASAWAAQSRIEADTAGADWAHQTFGDRPPTHYQAVQQQGRWAVHAHSAAGNSSLRRAVALPPGQTAGDLRFSWWVPRLNEAADLRDSDIDDAVARVVLSFDGDRAGRFSVRDHMLSELAQLVTGEPLPYATLVYVWDGRVPLNEVVVSQRSDRVRTLVVESGRRHLKQWRHYQRDLAADFRRAFGEEPGPLRGMAVMTDADNTGSKAEAWYGDIHLR
jgi:Protein of unknown function (DUF3047)